jgi:hypothetical protein
MLARFYFFLASLCFAFALLQFNANRAYATLGGDGCTGNIIPPDCGTGICKTCAPDPGNPTRACCCLDSTGTKCKP